MGFKMETIKRSCPFFYVDVCAYVCISRKHVGNKKTHFWAKNKQQTDSSTQNKPIPDSSNQTTDNATLVGRIT